MIRVNENWVIMVDELNYQPMRDMHRMKTVKQKDGTTTDEPYYKGGYGYYTSLKMQSGQLHELNTKMLTRGRKRPCTRR